MSVNVFVERSTSEDPKYKFVARIDLGEDCIIYGSGPTEEIAKENCKTKAVTMKYKLMERDII